MSRMSKRNIRKARKGISQKYEPLGLPVKAIKLNLEMRKMISTMVMNLRTRTSKMRVIKARTRNNMIKRYLIEKMRDIFKLV